MKAGSEEAIMTYGVYTRDFYFLPTILFHNSDGIYMEVEIAWLNFYVGYLWQK